MIYNKAKWHKIDEKGICESFTVRKKPGDLVIGEVEDMSGRILVKKYLLLRKIPKEHIDWVKLVKSKGEISTTYIKVKYNPDTGELDKVEEQLIKDQCTCWICTEGIPVPGPKNNDEMDEEDEDEEDDDGECEIDNGYMCGTWDCGGQCEN